ncbi:MAG: hypothetical protein KAQ81_04915, partial [Deltaproteobacteria bacterium]|nr:hypothetical protein [Deltaproteobacteria bacterium]
DETAGISLAKNMISLFRNSKSEARAELPAGINTKQLPKSKCSNEQSPGISVCCLGHYVIRHSNLFRISVFLFLPEQYFHSGSTCMGEQYI